MADDYEDERAAAAQGAELPALQPVTVKSITLQSFTFPEFFYRCSGEYPLLEFVEGDKRARSNFNQPVWFGRACNLDEAYEFFGDLGMLSTARSDKDKGSPSTNASTLNTLIACGKTRRATRSSTNFGAARGKTVSVSVLGNAHPNKFIPMERGLLGNHTACTKERFTVCLDAAAPRHAALSRDSTVKAGTSPWTWLPLTPQQAHAFGWEKFFNQPNKAREGRLPEDQASIEGEADAHGAAFDGPVRGYIIELPDGVESRLRYRRTSATSVRTEFRTVLGPNLRIRLQNSFWTIHMRTFHSMQMLARSCWGTRSSKALPRSSVHCASSKCCRAGRLICGLNGGPGLCCRWRPPRCSKRRASRHVAACAICPTPYRRQRRHSERMACAIRRR